MLAAIALTVLGELDAVALTEPNAAVSARRIIMLSPGTTATHGIYHTLCSMGFPTVHWSTACQPNCHQHIECEPSLSPAACERKRAKADEVIDDKEGSGAAFPAHDALLQLYKQAVACLMPTKLTGQYAGLAPYGSRACEADGWVSRVTAAVAQGVARETFSATDSPYPAMLSLLGKTQGFDDTLFIFSRRDSAQWASARQRDHPEDPVCDPAHWLGENSQQHASPFDLVRCVDACKRSLDSNLVPMLEQCTVRFGNLTAGQATWAFELHASAVEQYFGDQEAPGEQNSHGSRLLSLRLFDDETGQARKEVVGADEITDLILGWARGHGLEPPCLGGGGEAAHRPTRLWRWRKAIVGP